MELDFIQYLPKIPQTYWERYYYEITPTSAVTLAPNQTTSVLPSSILDKRGIIWFAYMTMNSTTARLDVVVDGRNITTDMEQVFKAGSVGIHIPNLPYVLKWDTVHNIYSVAWEPLQPFNHDVVIKFTNTGNQNMQILAFLTQIYIFNEGFYEQLEIAKHSQQLSLLMEIAKKSGVTVENIIESTPELSKALKVNLK